MSETNVSICVLATRRELQDQDTRLMRVLRAIGAGADLTVWAIDGVSDADSQSVPSTARLIGKPEGEPLLLILSADSLVASLTEHESGRRLAWMDFETFHSALPAPLRSSAIRHLQTAAGVCATSEDDAFRWAADLGDGLPVVDLGAFERRSWLAAEPLIEKGLTPRILIDLGGSLLDQRAVEAYLALEGGDCEIWHIHPGELRSWMRPDMQFRGIPEGDRGLFYSAVDAALVDEETRGAAERIKDYLSAGVVPIPLAGGDLCRSALLALGLDAVGAAPELKLRISAWLAAAAQQRGLRERTAAYAEAEGYVAAAGEALTQALMTAHRQQASSLGRPDKHAADTPAQRIALDRAGRSWRRWEDARPSTRAQASTRVAVRVEGWAKEAGSDAACELLLLSASSSARLGRSPQAETSGWGASDQRDAFMAQCLLSGAETEDLSGQDGMIGDLAVAAVGTMSGALSALRSRSPAMGSGSEILLRALARQADTGRPTVDVSGAVEKVVVTRTRAVSVSSRDVEAGQSVVRAFDDAGEPVTSGLWLSLEGTRHRDLVLLEGAPPDGVRPICLALKEAIAQSEQLTFWSSDAEIAAIHIYNPD